MYLLRLHNNELKWYYLGIAILVRIALRALYLGYYTHKEKEGYVNKTKKIR